MNRFAAEMADFMANLVILDETWLHHYDPQTKQQSMEWQHSDSPRPMKFRPQKSAGKILGSVFWNKGGVLLLKYLPKGRTINAEYYTFLLDELIEVVKQKCCDVLFAGQRTSTRNSGKYAILVSNW